MEGEILGDVSATKSSSTCTLGRVCPGRLFSYRVVEAITPLVFPDFQCQDGHQSFSGIVYEPISIDAKHPGLEILLARRSDLKGSSRHPSLVVFATAILEVPEVWAKTLDELLQINPDLDLWVLNPIGNGEMMNTAAKVAAILTSAKNDLKYQSVVLVSTMLAGWIAAYQLRDQHVLDGLVTLNTPHRISSGF